MRQQHVILGMGYGGGVASAKQLSKSIREGSFFSKSRLSLQKWLLLIYLWARDYPVKDVAQEAEIDKNTGCDVMNWFREVCSTKLITTDINLGGPGKTVQIDESLFRHKPKVYNY